MTAPSTMPAEVQAVVADLCRYDRTTLARHTPAAINAAFDHGVIEVAGSAVDTHCLDWRTTYKLRGRTVNR